MKLAIIGSRNFCNKNRLFLELNEIRKLHEITEIISGGAAGADTLGEEYADENNIKKVIFKADWSDMSEPCRKKFNKFGKEYNALAGFKRNSQIIDYCDTVIAFWDGVSPGTKDSIDKAKQQQKQVVIIKF